MTLASALVTPPGPQDGSSQTRVLALVLGRAERARLASAIGRGAHIVWVDRVLELRQRWHHSEGNVELLVIEPLDLEGQPTAALVATLTARHPEIAVVGYCDAGSAHSRHVVALAQAGIHDILFRGATDTGTQARHVFESAFRVHRGRSVLDSIRTVVPAESAFFFEYCLVYPLAANSVDAAARGIGVSRRTLVGMCSRSRLPVPGELLGWCRILLAARLTGNVGLSVERAALALGMASGGTLRNLIRRYARLQPSALRAADGFQRALVAFTQRILAVRARETPSADH